MSVTPLALPGWWTACLREVSGIDVDDHRQLASCLPALQRLTTYLNDTSSRSTGAQRYMKDARLRASYLIYYSTANMLKTWRPLSELVATGSLPASGTLRVLDLGAGPGTGAAGLAALFSGTYAGLPQLSLAITAVDAVSANCATYREVAARVAANAGVEISVSTVTADLATTGLPEGEFDLILAMNVMNELPSSRRLRLLGECAAHLAPHGAVLLIEPALRDTSRALLSLRDHAVHDGWTVHAPCLRQDTCPALEKESDWCHDDVPWDRPTFMAQLDEGMGNIKKSLKYSYLTLTRDGRTLSDAHAEGKSWRVVSERFDEKGRSWCHLCGEAGRVVCQRNHRDRSEANADFGAAERYDILDIAGEEIRAHDLRITPDSPVKLLQLFS